MRRPRLRRTFAGPVLAAAVWACGPIVDPSPDPDPCAVPPTPLGLDAEVSGTLDATADCLDRDGRLFDAFEVTLPTARAFTVTLAAGGFLPFAPTYREDGVQLSGWASDSATTLTREHLYPTGVYVVRASSYGKAVPGAGPPEGAYVLATEGVAVPQEGCGRETSITYGSVAEARLTGDDCVRSPGDEPGRSLPADGYAAILEAGRDMTAIVSAAFPFRVDHVADGVPTATSGWLPAGSQTSLTASAAGFHDFYVFATSAAEGGSYVARFVEGAAGRVVSVGGGRRPPP